MNRVLSYYKYLMRRVLLSWRMLAVLLAVILTMDTFLSPVRAYCKSTGKTLGPWGFALIWNNKYVILCFLLIYIFAVSNFPESREKERYFIARIGLSDRVGAQACFLVTFGWIYAGVLYIVSVLMILGPLEWTNEWGSGWISLADRNVIMKYGMYITMPGRVLSNYAPYQANLLVFVIMVLLLGMTGMLILWLNFYSRTAGSLAASAMVFVCLAAERYINLYRYSPASWLQLDYHYSMINPKRPTKEYIISVLLVLTVLFFMLAKTRANHTQENNRRRL